jgi:hypothetical protein
VSESPNKKSRGALPHALIAFGGAVVVTLLILVMVCLCTNPLDSPLHHEYGQMLHGLVWYATGATRDDAWDNYTGVVRDWSVKGRLLYRHEYKNGLRDGVWIDYSIDGSIFRVCEYRKGEPWNGVCEIIPMKAFAAEYRHGRPWYGVTWYYDREKKGSVDRFWVDGHEVTEAEFDAAPGFTEAQLRQPIGVIVPVD